MIRSVRIITTVLLVLCFQSCKVTRQSTTSDSPMMESKARIAFISCSMHYDSLQQEYAVRLINKTITEGNLKPELQDTKKEDEEKFCYNVLDRKSQVLVQSYIPSPLDKTVEYVNDQGLLGKKDIRLDSAEFFIRIPLVPEAKYVSFDLMNSQLLLIDLEAKDK